MEDNNGYRPMSYEEALKEREKNKIQREREKKLFKMNNTYPSFIDPFLDRDYPLLRKVGIVVVIISLCTMIMTFLLFFIIDETDCGMLSMERTSGVVTSLVNPKDNADKASIVMLEYEYNKKNYEEKVAVSEKAGVNDSVWVYVKKGDPTDVSDVAMVKHTLKNLSEDFYEVEIGALVIGIVMILYSYGEYRRMSRQATKERLRRAWRPSVLTGIFRDNDFFE